MDCLEHPISPLMRLPPATRYQILKKVLTIMNTAPARPKDALVNRVRYFDASWGAIAEPDRTPIWIQESDPVYTNDRPGRASQAALQATNRQLRAETRQILAQMQPELDVMYVMGCGMFPTWVTPVPVLQNPIPRLHIRVRGFDGPPGADCDCKWLWMEKTYRRGKRYNEQGLTTMQCHAMLLSRYLLEASAGLGLHRDEAIDYSYCTDSDLDSTPREERSNNGDEHSTSSEESSTSNEKHPTVNEELGGFRFPVIQTVVIEVEASDLDQSFPYTRMSYPWFGSLVFAREYELSGVDFTSPENPRVGPAAYKLAGAMAEALHYLLQFPAQDHTDYSEYVFANVGEFRIVVAGETMITVYVGCCYNELYRFYDSPGGRRSDGQEVPWVRRAAERRRREDLDRNCNEERHPFLLRPVPPRPSMF